MKLKIETPKKTTCKIEKIKLMIFLESKKMIHKIKTKTKNKTIEYSEILNN